MTKKMIIEEKFVKFDDLINTAEPCVGKDCNGCPLYQEEGAYDCGLAEWLFGLRKYQIYIETIADDGINRQ